MFKNTVVTGGTFYNTRGVKKETQHSGALKILTDAASPSAFHNSGSRYDPPKCHENTRVAVLEKLVHWAIAADPETMDKWIMWLYGGAGAGKSAIAQTFAERCDAERRLLASFFFGRSDPTRNHAKSLIPTIVYQIYSSIPPTREHIMSVIENDPLIFERTLFIQLVSLVIKPLGRLGDTISQTIIIIDGLDECVDKASQTAILRTLFEAMKAHTSRIRILVASRPEHDILTTFSLQDNTVLGKLLLDDEYKPDEDIELFLRDKIRGIKNTHPFRHLIPPEWPEDEEVDEIVQKSSGQFIYASIVVKFIESIRHQPNQRLDIVRNLRPAQGDMPFAELDALYTHILTSAQEVSIIVELLSFVLYSSQARLDVNVPFLEEIYDLQLGTLQLMLCDLGALVLIDGKETIKVLHASLLDFLLDQSRSKDLPISGDALMTKHIMTCFRFLSKNMISGGTDHIISSTETTIDFLTYYVGCIPIFTSDMAEALDGFSLLMLCQQDELFNLTKHNFLKWVNPVILELLHQSDQQQFLSQYLTMMDESFLALIDEYSPHTLALQISLIMHDNMFPSSTLDLAFQLPEFCKEDDTLGILCFNGDLGDLVPTQAQRNNLCEFLVDPTRSRHHNSLGIESRLYAMALLGCSDYLSKIIIREDYSIDEIWLKPHDTSVVSHEEMMPEDQSRNASPDNGFHEIAPSNSNDYVTVDTREDIRSWLRGWENCFGSHERVLRLARCYDLVSIKQEMEHCAEYYTLMRGRYYLMLGYLIYFFPLAGFSQELIRFCKTTVLDRSPRLFPEQAESAQRSMGAYLRRMAKTSNDGQNSHETIHTILPYTPLGSDKTHDPHDSHTSPSYPLVSSTAIGHQVSYVTIESSGSVDEHSLLRSAAMNGAGRKQTPKGPSSASLQSIALEQRSTPKKRGLRFLESPSTAPGPKRTRYV